MCHLITEIFSSEKMHKTLLILLLIFKYFILNEHRIQSNLGGWFLEYFITVINFLFGGNGILWA